MKQEPITAHESLLDEIDARIPASEFEAQYFPGGLVRVTIDLMAEMLAQITTVAEEQNWSRCDALVALLALGLGALQEEKARLLMEQDDQPARDELDLLVRRMRQMEMQYAIMKRRTWEFLKAYQAASLADGALRNQVAGLGALVVSLRVERDALRQQVAASEAERQWSQTQVSAVENDEAVSATSDGSPRRRLACRLGRQA